MKNLSTKKLAIFGFFFISIVGTLFHFVYELSGNNNIIGAFTAVNESKWEHVKIAIMPAFIWMIIECFIIKNKNNFFIAKLLSFATIIISMLLMVYGFKCILSNNVLIIDILIFYISIALGQYISYKIMNIEEMPEIFNSISVALLVFIFVIFVLFTYFPPRIDMFKDSTNNSYGITQSR